RARSPPNATRTIAGPSGWRTNSAERLGTTDRMATQQSDAMLAALKRAAAALREADIPFAVGGGIAVWARGGPATEHDIDLVIRPSDVDAALAALAEIGMRTERPPEEWLVKAWDGDVLIDLVFAPTGFEVDDALFERCEERNVQAV